MKIRDKQFAVIGLGQFGLSVCEELMEAGAQVLAVDIDEDKVKMALNFATQAIVANCTLEETVFELKLKEYDMVLIAIGEDINASILTTLVVKESGAKSVWVKANDKYHVKILHKVGANHVIMPERDMGIRVARKMLDRRVLEFIELGSGLALTEVVIGSQMMGKSIGDMPVYHQKGIKVLGFKRGPEVTSSPSLDTVLEIGDMLIVVGPQQTLTKQLQNL